MTSSDLTDFPVLVLHPERVLYRIHGHERDALHFASDDYGRFNLIGVPEAGTCYLATSELGAYVETLGRIGTISETDIAERHLAELVLLQDLRLADLTDRQVLGKYGIAGDMSTGINYAPSQALAARLYEAGFDGVYYTARHDPAFQERSVAVFGGSTESKLFVSASRPIPAQLVREGYREFGLLVLPPMVDPSN